MKAIVVGGGISGIFAAIELKRSGLDVLVLERKDRILKKMLVTGNGRCNITNADLSCDNYNDKDFVKPSLELNDNEDFRNYLKSLGIITIEEELGRIYPITLKAQTVVNQLLAEIEDLGIEILTESFVLDIKKEKDKFIVSTNEESYKADFLVCAAGGSSAPKLGTDGKFYKLLERLGHKKTEIYPALTQINLKSKYLKQISGVKVNGKVLLKRQDKILKEDQGELLFTSYGISGPPILNISKYVNIYKNDLSISMPLINILKEKDEKVLREEITGSFYLLNHYSLERWLMGILDKKLINMLLDKTGLDKNTVLSNLDQNDLNKILENLFSFEFEVLSTRDFENSHVSMGGISLEDVDKNNMMSKKVKNLYIIGELLDIDGDCGGYNIQWAFSSAQTCARDIAGKIN